MFLKVTEEIIFLADNAHKKQIENQQKKLAKKIEAEKGAAENIKGKLEGFVLEFVKRVGANGKLFGSVTTLEISKELKEKGIEVEKRIISLINPIKSSGDFTAVAKLFHDVSANFTVRITMDPKQAQELKEKEVADAKRKAEAKLAGEEENSEEAEVKPEEMTEDQKLKAEADKILRS
jgi:large subunit ribosomal protein L9